MPRLPAFFRWLHRPVSRSCGPGRRLVAPSTVDLDQRGLAYPSGIVAVRRLGSSLASFVSLTEVIFAVVIAFVLLGQRPGLMQLLGGALILVGIALVQRPVRLSTYVDLGF